MRKATTPLSSTNNTFPSPANLAVTIYPSPVDKPTWLRMWYLYEHIPYSIILLPSLSNVTFGMVKSIGYDSPEKIDAMAGKDKEGVQYPPLISAVWVEDNTQMFYVERSPGGEGGVLGSIGNYTDGENGFFCDGVSCY